MTDIEKADLGPASDRPIIVEITRGNLVESRHVVDAAIVDPDGKVVESWGNIEHPVYPRSANKPLQAIPLVESGAADAFDLPDLNVSLACASHAGEKIHVDTVLAWLDKLGLSDDDLECGGHYARNPKVLLEFFKSGAPVRQANNNCSGKHSGMLTHAVHLGDPTKNYIEPDHPVQQRITRTLGEMYGVDMSNAQVGTDGCSIPTYAIPTRAMALGMARFTNPDGLDNDRANACRRIARAMMAEPYMVGGMDSFCTKLMAAAKGKVAAKTGAEGVYMAGLPSKGLGIALKCQDGNGRAAEIALAAILDRYDVLAEDERQKIAVYLKAPVMNVNGLTVGRMRAVSSAAAAPF